VARKRVGKGLFLLARQATYAGGIDRLLKSLKFVLRFPLKLGRNNGIQPELMFGYRYNQLPRLIE
jgi:hypothetical protein